MMQNNFSVNEIISIFLKELPKCNIKIQTVKTDSGDAIDIIKCLYTIKLNNMLPSMFENEKKIGKEQESKIKI